MLGMEGFGPYGQVCHSLFDNSPKDIGWSQVSHLSSSDALIKYYLSFFFFHLHQETLKKFVSCTFQEGETNDLSRTVSSNTFTSLAVILILAGSS